MFASEIGCLKQMGCMAVQRRHSDESVSGDLEAGSKFSPFSVIFRGISLTEYDVKFASHYTLRVPQ